MPPILRMSVRRGKPEVAVVRQNRREWTPGRHLLKQGTLGKKWARGVARPFGPRLAQLGEVQLRFLDRLRTRTCRGYLASTSGGRHAGQGGSPEDIAMIRAAVRALRTEPAS